MRLPRLALCFGLTGVRFAITGDWPQALACIVGAGVLDGFDGRIARLLRAQSKFGAELDSLSDNIAFGTAPALIIFLWSLKDAPRFGWIAALALAVCCALRLARFNARIDMDDQPHKSAGFNTGVPAPVGAGLTFVPVYLWLISGNDVFPQLDACPALDAVHCIDDDQQRPDLYLVFDPHPPRLATVGSRRSRTARCGAAERAVVDVAGDLRPLPGNAAVQHCRLFAGQAAARSEGRARNG